MSAQPNSEIAEAPIWSGWQNAVINGVYPLQRLLHGSEHSAVFLTERKGQAVPEAALKIIPIERVTLAQLSHWRVATGVSHPHLIQLFDAGLCHLDGRQFLFVVMEYAQQTLPEVLARRALTEDEVRELLGPTLKALTFLHLHGLVLAHLKPANVLVVDDQVKLASDSIHIAGVPRVGIAEPPAYDAPDANESPFSAADDMWGLGVTLVEALTQHLPWSDAQSDAVRLPDTLPAAFVDTVQRCLRYDPAARPRSIDLQVEFGGEPEPLEPLAATAAPETPKATDTAAAPVVHDSAPVVTEAPIPVAPTPELVAQRGSMPARVVIGCVLMLAAVWAGVHFFHTHPASAPLAAVPEAALVAPPVTAPPIAVQTPTAPSPAPAVLHKQLPDVSRSALGTIHGHVKVMVVAVVDRTGTVVDAHLKNAGPSSYFAGRARDAARRWKFAPAQGQGTREWLLRFEFARDGITASAAPGS